MNGLGTNCPSSRVESPDARSASYRQGFLRSLKDSIPLWRVLRGGYLRGCVISRVVSRASFISLDCFNVSLVAKLRAWLYVAVGVHCSRFKARCLLATPCFEVLMAFALLYNVLKVSQKVII